MIRLIQGEALRAMDQLISEGTKVDQVLTDPPYGTTACKWDSVIPFGEMWKRLKLLRKDRTPIVLFGSEPFSSHLRMSNIKEYKYDWIWDKKLPRGFYLCKKQPLRKIELISVFYKAQCVYNPEMRIGRFRKKGTKKNLDTSTVYKPYKRIEQKNDKYYPTNLIEFSNANNKDKIHPTQKPLDLMEYLIKTYTNEGDTVLDFTMGSGQTMIACHKLNRNGIGIDNGFCEKEKSKYYKMPWKEVVEDRLELIKNK